MKETEIRTKKAIVDIFRKAAELTELWARPFTPDGHMIGSMGETYAAIHYGIVLHPPSNKLHDGRWRKREVQIKATQKGPVLLKGITDLLLVLRINRDGTFDEIYNGDGKRPWQSLAHRKLTRAGQISISLKKLAALNNEVARHDKIPRIV